MEGSKHVVVLGAGVIGLTTAVFLVEVGYTVTVISAHVPGDSSIEYTSPWAGAHWRTHATPQEPMLCDWDVQTYEYWLELLERERLDPGLPKSGLKMYDSLGYWDGKVEELWWAPHVREFRQLSVAAEPVASVHRVQPEHVPRIKQAANCRAMAINVPQYLRYLQERAQKKGVIVFKSQLPTDGGLEKALKGAEGISVAIGRGKVDCFVNATGLGAANLCNDKALYPIRGQTVLVKGEATAIRTRIGDGYVAYCIPRPGSGTTILGGTKEVGNWSQEASPETTKQILERCSYIVPELQTASDGGFEVISSQCGLRPARQGGPRMEREVVAGRTVVHAYGHAGAGYQNSIGSARMTLRLVDESVVGSTGERVHARL